MRHAALASIVLIACASASRADEPPAGAVVGSVVPAAPAPATTAAAPDAFTELLPLVLDDAKLADYERAPAAKKAEFAERARETFAPHQLAQIRWIGEHLRENGSAVGQRAAALLVLGPPLRLHREASRTWPPTPAPVIASPRALVQALKGTMPAETSTVQGDLPTEIWVYPTASPAEMELVSFVDEGADGTFRYVERKKVPIATVVSEAPALEPPADLFPSAAQGATFAALPVLTKTGLPLALSHDAFKAAQGRTYVRFIVAIDPQDVDFELGVPPATWQAAAEAWLRVERDGSPVHQGSVALKDVPQVEGLPWLVELGAPLDPGRYQVTVLAHSGGAGGSKTETVEVPSFAGGLALSSPVLTRLAVENGQPVVPRAPATAAGAPPAPFQVGSYLARPLPGATFSRGQVVGLVVQVYNAPSASITYRLERDGTYEFETDPELLQPLPATEIYPLELTEHFTDGSYKLVVTARDPKSPDAVVRRDVTFRVRG